MNKTMFCLSVSLSFVTAQSAFAEAFEVECDSLENMDNQIEFCSDNQLAAKGAELCRAKLLRAVTDAEKQLGDSFKAAEPNDVSRQQVKFQFSASHYRETEAKLNHLINQTSHNMHMLASYPTVMMDDLDTGIETVACYTDNYKTLSKVVSDLDQKITELKHARDVAVALKDTTHGHDVHVGSESPADFILGGGDVGVGSGDYIPAGLARAPASDITGIREDIAKDEVLTSFPLKHQLTN